MGGKEGSGNYDNREREREREVLQNRRVTLTAQLDKTRKMLANLPPYDPAREALTDLVQRLADAVAGLPDPEK
jgi:hypothetical protein